MSGTLADLLWLLAAPAVAWVFGRLHMALVSRDKWGKLGKKKERCRARQAQYAVSTALTFAVIAGGGTAVGAVKAWTTMATCLQLAFILGVTAGLYGGLVLGFSQVEAFWFASIRYPDCSGASTLQRLCAKTFWHACLPMLYGSLSLHYLALLVSIVLAVLGFAT
jgi:hypothetical protein